MSTEAAPSVLLELRADVHEPDRRDQDPTAREPPPPRPITTLWWSLVGQRVVGPPSEDEAHRLVSEAVAAMGALPEEATGSLRPDEPHLWISARLVLHRELEPIFGDEGPMNILTNWCRVQVLNWPATAGSGEDVPEFERAQGELARVGRSLPTGTWTPMQ
jgi:hypothetical protein